MPFVKKIITNRYSHKIVRSGEYIYVFINEIIDGLGNHFVVTQFNLQGELIWEKNISSNYMTSSNYNLLLNKILPLDNNGILIIGYSGNLCLLSRMDEFGNVIWSKLFDFGDEIYGHSYSPFTFNILCEDDGFILHIPYNTNGSSLIYHHRILKFDYAGALIFNKKFHCNNRSSFFDKIHKRGNEYYISALNTITEFDQYFNIIDVSQVYINGNDNLTISDFSWTSNDEVIILGNGSLRQNSFFNFCSSLETGHFSRYNTLLFESTSDGAAAIFSFSNISFGNNYFYIINTKSILAKNTVNRVENYIYKYDTGLSLIWSKSYSDDDAYNLQQAFVEENILIYYSDFNFGIVDAEFNSCNTEDIISNPSSETANLSLVSVIDFDENYSITDESDIIFLSDQQLTRVNINDIEIQNICFEIPITIDENTVLQSPNFNLLAVGSDGTDSPSGIQLRWVFAGNLAETHLPKGNLAGNYNNYNKPNDFVKIYKAAYEPIFFSFTFTDSLQSVNNEKAYWIYQYDDGLNALNESFLRIFYVYFRNKTRYDEVLLTIDPFTNPVGFITSYGENIIEIESKEELFFAINPYYPRKTSFNIHLEAFSVEENKLNSPKILSYRNTLSQVALEKIFCENGRSIRYKSNKLITGFGFEFYSDFITNASQNNLLEEFGQYALSVENSVIGTRLDPDPANNAVNGRWLRYNEESYINIDNYLDKWQSSTVSNNPLAGDIKSSVTKYIELSNFLDNPKAIEYIDINGSIPNGDVTVEPGEEDNEKMKISHLDLLNIAAIDYHTARMLGLGTLDLSRDVVAGQEFVYISIYKTLVDINDVSFSKECQLISMSLPTSVNTQRLSLPIDITEIKFGPAFNTPESQNVCDENGYTFDGKYRMVKILTKAVPVAEINPSFFPNNVYFDASMFTLPIYGGIKHRYYIDNNTMSFGWAKPELLYDKKYKNIDSTFKDSYESIPIMLPKSGEPLYIHRQSESGYYDYATYGINIFSRSTISDNIVNVETRLKPKNTLRPPSENSAWLILNERPLMFTSQYEQDRYTNNLREDKTLVRIYFSYDYQDIITHNIPAETTILDDAYLEDNTYFPDEYDLFADSVEIFYRASVPKAISAKVYEVVQNQADQLQVIFKTKEYFVASTGETFYASYPDGTSKDNFVGGIFLLNGISYIINNITQENNNSELYFYVYKKEVSSAIISSTDFNINYQGLSFPIIDGTELFNATENMQTKENWGNQNPNSLSADINNDWTIHREVIYTKTENNEIVKYLEKSRGIWGSATIEPYKDDNGNHIAGFYTIRFDNLKLGQHRQFDVANNSVEFYNGKVRLFRKSTIENGKALKSRESFKVFKTENIVTNPIGRPRDLVLHIVDPHFDSSNTDNELLTGADIEVNYYPGYCAYLYEESDNNLIYDSVLPVSPHLIKYSVFGLRTVDTKIFDDTGQPYTSKFSIPILMYGQGITEPIEPEKPEGVLFATRPDFYGKSTYSFTTKFNQRPFSIQFYRGNDNAVFSVFYEQDTIRTIKENLNYLGGYNESFLTNRWSNFFNFSSLEDAVEYASYPDGEDAYRFPLPDNIIFFQEINLFITKHNAQYGTNNQLIPEINFGMTSLNHTIIQASDQNKELKLIHFIEEAVYYAFVPLTEVPVLYQHIKSNQENNYLPINKKQNVRDKYGVLLAPENGEFDMAPMMAVMKENTVLFTDFTLDGTVDNICFYGSREIGTQMGQSDMSEILGPVRLVNSNAPDTPKISSANYVLENKALEILPKIKVEIQPYPEVQKIDRINLYRSIKRLDSESILSMTLVNSYNVSDMDLDNQSIWTIYDELLDFENIPYGDVLYYRVTVERKIQYGEPVSPNTAPRIIVDYAPSQASKIMALVVTENQNPGAPVLTGTGTREVDDDVVTNVTLQWNTACYKGTYHLYNMSSQGNWTEIARFITNKTNDKVQLQIIDPNPIDGAVWVNKEVLNIMDFKITLSLNLLGADYNQFPLFDQNDNRKYYHLKVVSENTSNMFSIEENILTLFTDDIWKDLQGISSNGTSNGMIIGKTFIIK